MDCGIRSIRGRNERGPAARGRRARSRLSQPGRPRARRARRRFRARPGAARHRRRVRFGQIDDGARDPRPDSRAGRSEGAQTRFRRARSDWAPRAGMARTARPAPLHGDAGPEILAEPRATHRRADHGDLSAASPVQPTRGGKARVGDAGSGAYPRSGNGFSALSAPTFRRHGPTRAMIAMMLIADPDLLIADEPTSA